jgi:hypothetical protein
MMHGQKNDPSGGETEGAYSIRRNLRWMRFPYPPYNWPETTATANPNNLFSLRPSRLCG